ncbi:MAG: tryptophan-rich sensory protein [Pedobacter sp.]|nr:MAG: tryptophan-rich sensory protein [Pedobacter sp.]
MQNWKKLIISLIIPQLVAASGAYFTITGTGSWYQSLEKPSWNPPSWVFGPVWTTLYILMGIALFLVWKSDTTVAKKRSAVILWSVQLLFNFLWSFLFFGQEQIFLALIEIVILWVLILLTIFAFARINKLSAWLLVPYISWVSFATILTYTIWELNR